MLTSFVSLYNLDIKIKVFFLFINRKINYHKGINGQENLTSFHFFNLMITKN